MKSTPFLNNIQLEDRNLHCGRGSEYAVNLHFNTVYIDKHGTRTTATQFKSQRGFANMHLLYQLMCACTGMQWFTVWFSVHYPVSKFSLADIYDTNKQPGLAYVWWWIVTQTWSVSLMPWAKKSAFTEAFCGNQFHPSACGNWYKKPLLYRGNQWRRWAGSTSYREALSFTKHQTYVIWKQIASMVLGASPPHIW